MQTADERLLSARKALGHPSLQTLLPTCIVHGDMNAGNVIVGDQNRVIFIDYRHSGCGIRSVDFAAVEASLRLLHADKLLAESVSTAARLAVDSHKGEFRVWRLAWSTEETKRTEAIKSLEYWQRVSCAIVAHARENFSDLQAKEYAGTCLYWAPRLFRWQRMSLESKAKLLAWIVGKPASH